jgi:hypothetical protein
MSFFLILFFYPCEGLLFNLERLPEPRERIRNLVWNFCDETHKFLREQLLGQDGSIFFLPSLSLLILETLSHGLFFRLERIFS